MPYIWGSSQECVITSLLLMRSLVIEYQDDPNVWNMNDQFLFGRDILVAPILDSGTRRKVYLPKGVWIDWWTNKKIAGGQWIAVMAGLDTLPLYIREGAVIPMGPVMNYTQEFPYETLEVRITPMSADGRRRFIIPVNNEEIAVDYRRVKGKHTIKTGKTKIKITFVTLGNGKTVR